MLKIIKPLLPMPMGIDPMIGAAAITGGSGLLGGLFGGIGARGRERRQVRNQKKLMDHQMGNQQRLNEQGKQLALEMWKETSYPAQMKMMEEAGLNPALMYGQAGAGGTTQGQSGGSAQGGAATQGNPMELNIAAASAKTAADILVAKSQADKLQAEAESLRGEEGTVGASQIEENLAGAMNKRSLSELNKLGLEIGNATKEDQIDNAHFAVERIIKENNLTDKQAKLAKVQATSLGVKMQLDKANIKVSNEQARKISSDIILGWKELDAKLQEIGVSNQANKLRGMEGKVKIQQIQNDFILNTLGKEIDLMKLNVEQQKIFAQLFNGMLGEATNLYRDQR